MLGLGIILIEWASNSKGWKDGRIWFSRMYPIPKEHRQLYTQKSVFWTVYFYWTAGGSSVDEKISQTGGVQIEAWKRTRGGQPLIRDRTNEIFSKGMPCMVYTWDSGWGGRWKKKYRYLRLRVGPGHTAFECNSSQACPKCGGGWEGGSMRSQKCGPARLA